MNISPGSPYEIRPVAEDEFGIVPGSGFAIFENGKRVDWPMLGTAEEAREDVRQFVLGEALVAHAEFATSIAKPDPAHLPLPVELVPATEHHGPYITNCFGLTVCDFYTMTLPNEKSTASGGPSRPVHFGNAVEFSAYMTLAANSHAILVKALKQAKYAIKGREHTGFIDAALKAAGEI